MTIFAHACLLKEQVPDLPPSDGVGMLHHRLGNFPTFVEVYHVADLLQTATHHQTFGSNHDPTQPPI